MGSSEITCSGLSDVTSPRQQAAPTAPTVSPLIWSPSSQNALRLSSPSKNSPSGFMPPPPPSPLPIDPTSYSRFPSQSASNAILPVPLPPPLTVQPNHIPSNSTGEYLASPRSSAAPSFHLLPPNGVCPSNESLYTPPSTVHTPLMPPFPSAPQPPPNSHQSYSNQASYTSPAASVQASALSPLDIPPSFHHVQHIQSQPPTQYATPVAFTGTAGNLSCPLPSLYKHVSISSPPPNPAHLFASGSHRSPPPPPPPPPVPGTIDNSQKISASTSDLQSVSKSPTVVTTMRTPTSTTTPPSASSQSVNINYASPSRVPSPFDKGPFPASSIPVHLRNTLTPSPPPPRPPKPAELWVDGGGFSFSPSSEKPEENKNSMLTPSSPDFRQQAKSLSERHQEREVVNVSRHVPTYFHHTFPDSLPDGASTRVGIDPEDTRLQGSGMDGDVRVSDSSEIQLSRVQPDDENLIPSLSGGRMGEPTSVPATVMGPLRDNGSRQDMGDSGHTMESYDPAKFDFPRRVNDEMANILSPIGPSSSSYSDPTASRFDSTTTIASVTTIETDPTPAVQQFPPTSVASETRMRGEESLCVLLPDDGDPLPPSYEQVEVEIDIERLREEEEARGRTQAEKNVALSSRSLSPALQRSSFEGAGSSRFEGMDANGSRQQHPTIDLSSDDHTQSVLNTSRSSSPVTFSHPSILASPPIPSSHGSPYRQQDLRLTMTKKFTVSSIFDVESPISDLEGDDPSQDPPFFQTDSSPFAPNQDTELTSLGGSVSSMAATDRSAYSTVEIGRTEAERARSNSGFWSIPPTPRSDYNSDEMNRRIGDYNYHGSGTSQGQVSAADGSKLRKRAGTPTSVRMTRLFGGSGSVTPTSTSGRRQDSREFAMPSPREATGPRPMSSSRKGVDLLDDGARVITDFNDGGPPGSDYTSVLGSGGSTLEWGGVRPLNTEDQSGDQRDLNAQSVDIWEGIEFGLRAPNWTTPPSPGPFSNPYEWRKDITLYPLGSDPFFIRAPTWRSLLRFLASQSTTRIEPSVEALATSRTPTIDLRLVVQFTRNPYTPRGTTRDICLYMSLHTEMPPSTSRAGLGIPFTDRQALTSWDTRVLPYGFICAEGGLLSKPNRRQASSSQGSHRGSGPPLSYVGTPLSDQDPDGEDSMFVTLPPPFIELPVNLSDIALYLHESLVQSRKNRKVHHEGKGKEPSFVPGRNQKPNASTPNLPNNRADGAPEINGTYVHPFDPKRVPGMKRLSKAVKTFYPDEYAIGSTKANHAAAQAAVDDGDLLKGRAQNVANTNSHGGLGKSSLLSAFQRVRSKSSAAKQAVSGLGVGSSSGGGRDTNAERYELVTPWREN